MSKGPNLLSRTIRSSEISRRFRPLDLWTTFVQRSKPPLPGPSISRRFRPLDLWATFVQRSKPPLPDPAISRRFRPLDLWTTFVQRSKPPLPGPSISRRFKPLDLWTAYIAQRSKPPSLDGITICICPSSQHTQTVPLWNGYVRANSPSSISISPSNTAT